MAAKFKKVQSLQMKLRDALFYFYYNQNKIIILLLTQKNTITLFSMLQHARNNQIKRIKIHNKVLGSLFLNYLNIKKNVNHQNQ